MSGICSMLGAMKSLYRILIDHFKRIDHREDSGCEHSKDAATLLPGLGYAPRRTFLCKCGRRQEP